MQVSGTFPELSAGRSKGKRKPDAGGVGGFKLKGRAPKRHSAPSSFAARRAASHAKAYGKS